MDKVKVPFNPKRARTANLIKGLYNGFCFTHYEYDAVRELIERGEQKALIKAQKESKSPWAKHALKKAGIS